MRRVVSGWTIALVLLLSAGRVCALGLGELAVHSALNEPLRAELALFGVEREAIDAVRVGLAPVEAFRAQGIPYPSNLPELAFQVVGEGSQRARVSLRTQRPLQEPALELLLLAEAPDGRVLRAYTLLLDPPKPDSVASAPPPRRVAAPAPRRHEVRRGETLGAIAEPLARSYGVGVMPMMLALYRANPEAFAAANMNSLRAGAVLAVPPRADVQAIAPAQARREVQEQWRAWQRRGNTPSDRPPARPPAREPDVPIPPGGRVATAEGSATAPRLRLAAPPPADPQTLRLRERLAALDQRHGEVMAENRRLRERLGVLEEHVLALTEQVLARIENSPPVPAAAPRSRPAAPVVAASMAGPPPHGVEPAHYRYLTLILSALLGAALVALVWQARGLRRTPAELLDAV